MKIMSILSIVFLCLFFSSNGMTGEVEFTAGDVVFVTPSKADFFELSEYGIEPMYSDFIGALGGILQNVSPGKSIEITGTRLRGFAVHRVYYDASYGEISPATTMHQIVIEVKTRSSGFHALCLGRAIPVGAIRSTEWHLPAHLDSYLYSPAPISEDELCEFSVDAGFGNSFPIAEPTRCLIVEWFGERTANKTKILEKGLSPDARRAKVLKIFNSTHAPDFGAR